jgi:hypothetical protein
VGDRWRPATGSCDHSGSSAISIWVLIWNGFAVGGSYSKNTRFLQKQNQTPALRFILGFGDNKSAAKLVIMRIVNSSPLLQKTERFLC